MYIVKVVCEDISKWLSDRGVGNACTVIGVYIYVPNVSVAVKPSSAPHLLIDIEALK